MKQSTQKDTGQPVRISMEHYKRIRQEAFDKEISMKELLDSMIDHYYERIERGGEILMKYGYARVSTTGQTLEGQIKTLKEEKCDQIFAEKYTGTKKERPEFQKLLEIVDAGDTLVVTKLDRFARSTKDALETIEGLFNRQVRVHVLNLGIIEDSPTGRLIFTVMSAFADFERDLIVERTQEGKRIAKSK